jgi:hypothetical protein
MLLASRIVQCGISRVVGNAVYKQLRFRTKVQKMINISNMTGDQRAGGMVDSLVIVHEGIRCQGPRAPIGTQELRPHEDNHMEWRHIVET